MEITSSTPLITFFLLAVVLTAAAVIDIRIMYVPDTIHLCTVGLAVFSLFTEHGPTLVSRVCGSPAIGGAMLFVSILTNGGIGGGDIKPLAASGLLLGFPKNLLAFILAYVTAGPIYAIPMLFHRIERNRQIPMTPYFVASILISYLPGERIIGWYLQFFVMRYGYSI